VLIVGNRSVSQQDAAEVLAQALKRIPEISDRRFPIGKYRGLSFGMECRWGHPQVFLSGQCDLNAEVAESRGPRAVLNALGRIISSYDERIEANVKDLELSQNQLHDYQVRLGRPFTHTTYLQELTGLRDRLKVALWGTPAEGDPTAAELAKQIKTLKAAQVIEAAPVRVREKPRAEVVRRRVE
jgi:hypothetical protein